MEEKTIEQVEGCQRIHLFVNHATLSFKGQAITHQHCIQTMPTPKSY